MPEYLSENDRKAIKSLLIVMELKKLFKDKENVFVSSYVENKDVFIFVNRFNLKIENNDKVYFRVENDSNTKAINGERYENVCLGSLENISFYVNKFDNMFRLKNNETDYFVEVRANKEVNSSNYKVYVYDYIRNFFGKTEKLF